MERPTEQMPRREFLTAEWRNLAILNYAVEPSVLAAWVPRGTELDQFGGKTYISLVGFRFLRTRVHGLWIPLHSDFDEVNLRFYVKRQEAGQTRRGVVFVKEVVPRYAVAVTTTSGPVTQSPPANTPDNSPPASADRHEVFPNSWSPDPAVRPGHSHPALVQS